MTYLLVIVSPLLSSAALIAASLVMPTRNRFHTQYILIWLHRSSSTTVRNGG